MKSEKKKRILLVEDEAFIAMAVKMTLEKYGYEAIISSTGEEAIETVETIPDIDLILMDIDLGRGIDGTEAAVKILDKHDLPLIFLSSHTEREVVEKTEGITSYGYIVKNTGETVLIASIKMAFRLFEAKLMKRDKEGELQNSELKFRGLVESSSDWIWEVNTEGIYTYASPKVEDILGYKPDEITGKTPFDLMPQEETERIRQIFTDLVNERKPIVSLENVALHKDGRRIILETSGVPFFNSTGNISGYRGVDRDITERKQIEMALLEREERLSSLTDQSPLAIQVFDTDGFVVQVNRAWKQLWGAPLEELIRLEYNILKDEQAKKVGLLPYLEKAYSGEVVSIPPKEYDASGSSETGNKRWVQSHVYPLKDESGNVVNIVALQEDITGRIKTEKALKESESLYKILVETSTDGIVLTDLEGKYTFCNRRHVCLLGYDSTDELIGKNGFDFFAPESLERAEKILQNLFIDKHIENIIFEVVRKDGSRILTEFSATVIYDEQQNPINIMCLMKDVTERQKAEKALSASEERWKSLTLNAPGFITIVDRNFIIEYINHTVSGLTYDDVIGLSVFDFIQPEYHDLAQKKIENVFSTGQSNSYESVAVGPDDTLAYYETRLGPVIIDENIISVSLFSTNLSQRRQAENALQNEKMLTDEYINSLPGLFYVFDEERFIRWNKRWEIVTGYTSEEITGMYGPDFFHGTDKMIISERMEEVFTKGASETEAYLSTKQGKRIPFYFSGIRKEFNGKPHLIGLGFDISELKQAEEKIKFLLQEKTILLKEVHHRIKNNMNVMKSLFSMQSQSIVAPEAISALQDAICRIDSMGVLYDKLYRTESYQNVSVKEYLPQLVNEIIQMFPNKMDIKLETKMDDFAIDTRIIFPLGIIINELLTNTMKHAFIGRDSGLIQLSSTINKSHVTIALKDNGIGMPELKKNEEQKGFGIMLISLLTDQIGGNYKIERKNGTKFIIEFDI